MAAGSRGGRGRKLGAGLVEMAVRIAQQAVGEKRGIAQGERGKIGRAGQRRREQVAHRRPLFQDQSGRRKFVRGVEGLGQGVEDVGAARLVIDQWPFGDALDEGSHAGLSSDPGAGCFALPLARGCASVGSDRMTLRPG